MGSGDDDTLNDGVEVGTNSPLWNDCAGNAVVEEVVEPPGGRPLGSDDDTDEEGSDDPYYLWTCCVGGTHQWPVLGDACLTIQRRHPYCSWP